MASSGKGLNRNRVSAASLVVEPSAKYQWSDADEAHGVAESPSGPTTATSAAAAPPSSSMVAATNGAFTTS